MEKNKVSSFNVLFRKYMQNLSAVIYASLAALCFTSHFFYIILMIFGNNYLRAVLIIYGVWLYFNQAKEENEVRGKVKTWMRDNFIGKHFREYFPIELVKTAELPPNKNYILACHPHGIFSTGLFVNLLSDICKWDELFPKIRPKVATIPIQFSIPFWCHIAESWGLISVSKKSLFNNLTTSNDPNDPINADGNTATAVAIVVGGVLEAMDTKPRRYVLTIKNRKGFVKVAMQTGAAIVPSFSFGENDIFDQVDTPFMRKLQLFIKNKIGIPPLIILGRNLFKYQLSLVPERRRIVQVVGSPIDVPKCDNPSEEELDKLHQKFMHELNLLFETHKAKYLENAEQINLVMI